MNRAIQLTTIIALALPAAAIAAATSTIRDVELFPAGAAVTRTVEVAASPDGSVLVELGGLPASLLDSSVQIAVSAADLRVGGFAFLPNENPVTDDDPRTAEMRAKVDGIDEALRLNKLERESIQSRIAHYNGMAESIRKALAEAATADALRLGEEAWRSLEQVRAEGEKRLAGLALDSKRLGIDRQKAQKDLDELVQALGRRSGVLKFDLSGNLAAGARLLVRYQVSEAGWSPVHEVRADPAGGALEWIYKARVWQQTGEDWDGVAVTLNSASALYAGGLPPLDPLFLDKMEYGPMQRSKVAMTMDQVVLAAPEVMAGAALAEAKPESTTTGFFIRLPKPLTLASGKPAVVREAFTGRLKTDFWSEAVPELSTDAWLMAGTTNELGWPILGGETYFYIDGQLVARRHMESIAAGEEMRLALGRNEKVSIERKERKRKESQGGLIDKTKRHDIKYETTVQNRMAVAHKVVLQDRFPVGRDNKIQVRIVSPKDVTPEEGTGLFKWERTLQAGGKDVLVTEYSVTYPAEWTIYPPL